MRICWGLHRHRSNRRGTRSEAASPSLLRTATSPTSTPSPSSSTIFVRTSVGIVTSCEREREMSQCAVEGEGDTGRGSRSPHCDEATSAMETTRQRHDNDTTRRNAP